MKKENDLLKNNHIQISLDGLLHALIEVSLPYDLRIILDGGDDADLGMETGENLILINFELLLSQKIINEESFILLKEMERDFKKTFYEIPYGKMEEDFWEIQRQKAQKIIEQLWL